MYHSLRLYKLEPQLRWTAGEYVWPADRVVDCGSAALNSPSMRSATSSRRRHRNRFALQSGFTFGSFSDSSDEEQQEGDSIRDRVIISGAVPLSQAGITLVTDQETFPGRITKEKVPYIYGDMLDKLMVNVILVVYVA